MKKNILIIVLFVLTAQLSFAALSEAEYYYIKAVNSVLDEEIYKYLHKLEETFTEFLNNKPNNTRALVGLSKVYQMLKDRQNAKFYILLAYNTNPNNPNLQKEMGDFYYNFQEYSTAIEYYKLSLINGNLNDFDTNLQIAKCFDKLEDSRNSQIYYKICTKLNPESNEISEKMNEIRLRYMDENNKKYIEKKKIQTKQKEGKKVQEIINFINSRYIIP